MKNIKVNLNLSRSISKESQPTLGSYATHLVWLGALPLKPQPYRAVTGGRFRTYLSLASPKGRPKRPAACWALVNGILAFSVKSNFGEKS